MFRILQSIPSSTDGPLWAVAFATKSTLLAAAGADRCIRIYKFHGNGTLQQTSILSGGHTKTIRSLHFSVDGLLAAASFDGTVSVWSPTSSNNWRCMATLEGHENEIKCARWSPDGRLLATCGRDRTVWIWRLTFDGDCSDEDDEYGHADSHMTVPETVEFECEAVLQEHLQDVKSLAWHPLWRRYLVSGGYDELVRCYGCPFAGEDEWVSLGDSITGLNNTIWSLCFHCSPDTSLQDGQEAPAMMSRVIAATDDGNLAIFRDANPTATNHCNADWRLVKSIAVHDSEPAYSVALLRDSLIVSGGGDGVVAVTDVEQMEVMTRLQLPGQVNCVAVYEKRYIAAALDDGTVVMLVYE